MGKQPYIPLYIGDWEQDTNCLSLEAEGAWLKIIFKCWKNQGIFIASIDSICRLLKVDSKKFATILLELKSNNICDIEEREDGCILFISRRLVREVEISRKRADSGSKGGSKKQANTIAKIKQKHEYEYDIEYDIEIIKIGVESENWIAIPAKFAGEKPRRIYNLEEYFKSTGQFDAISALGWQDKFSQFMKDNPAGIFEDDKHLYNSIRKFCTKEINGKKLAFEL